MGQIELTGLIGSHPLGALAAFGLLRVVSQSDPTAKLSFVERDDWIAVFDSRFASAGELTAFVETWSHDRVPEVLKAFGEDDVRIAPSRFREMLRNSLEVDVPANELPSFLVALAADGAVDNTKGLIKPSPFYMASGQQSFLDTMKKLRERVRKDYRWNDVLFGPWRYTTPEWGAGWDPGTERMHAIRHKAPSKDKTTCVAGAVGLAFEALPLFPTFSSGGVVKTVGWRAPSGRSREPRPEGGATTEAVASAPERERFQSFRWPLPTTPIGLDALGVLLAANERNPRKEDRNRRPLRKGIGAIYESMRYEFGQGYGIFRPAQLVVRG